MNSIQGAAIVSCISFLVLASCTDDKKESNDPVQQYGTTLTESYKKAQDLDRTVNVQQVQRSIQEFYAANGRYPADLSELSRFNGITLKNEIFDYDPETGMLIQRQ